MATEAARSCQCALCGSGLEHPDREYHRQMNLLLSRLDERQRRWYLAVESQRLGHGADRLLFETTGVDEKTIRRGREELAASLTDQPADRVRQPLGLVFQERPGATSKWPVEGVAHESVRYQAVNGLYLGGRVVKRLARITVKPRILGQSATGHIGAIEVAKVACSDAVVLARPESIHVGDVLKPEPNIAAIVCMNIQYPRRDECAGQVSQQARAVCEHALSHDPSAAAMSAHSMGS